MGTRAHTADEGPARRTHVALATLFGGLVAALAATVGAMLAAGIG